MALGFAVAFANEILNHAFRGVAFTPETAYYVKLHIGDPGAAGTANAAAMTTRKVATFGSAPSGGNLSNTSILAWDDTEINASETWTHASLWSAATAGTFKMSGTLPVAKAVTTDVSASIAVGDIDIALTVAA